MAGQGLLRAGRVRNTAMLSLELRLCHRLHGRPGAGPVLAAPPRRDDGQVLVLCRVLAGRVAVNGGLATASVLCSRSRMRVRLPRSLHCVDLAATWAGPASRSITAGRAPWRRFFPGAQSSLVATACSPGDTDGGQVTCSPKNVIKQTGVYAAAGAAVSVTGATRYLFSKDAAYCIHTVDGMYLSYRESPPRSGLPGAGQVWPHHCQCLGRWQVEKCRTRPQQPASDGLGVVSVSTSLGSFMSSFLSAMMEEYGPELAAARGRDRPALLMPLTLSRQSYLSIMARGCGCHSGSNQLRRMTAFSEQFRTRGGEEMMFGAVDVGREDYGAELALRQQAGHGLDG